MKNKSENSFHESNTEVNLTNKSSFPDDEASPGYDELFGVRYWVLSTFFLFGFLIGIIIAT